MMKTCMLVVAALAAVGCDKKPSESAKGEAKAGAAPVSDALAAVLPKKAPPAFAAWDLPARAKAWQGAWVIEETLGSPRALEIKGAAATTSDGKTDKTLAFELESPCSAKLIERGADGSTSSTTSHFTLKNGALVAGLGNAGARKGKAAIACVSDQILVLDDAGACTAWSNDFGRWKSEPGTCAFAQKDGKEVFTAKTHGSDTELLVDGDALLSTQLAGKSATKQADFAAAKAAIEK